MSFSPPMRLKPRRCRHSRLPPPAATAPCIAASRAPASAAHHAVLAVGHVADLHEQLVAVGQTAGGDDAVDGHAVVGESLDDLARAEGGRFKQRAVDVGAVVARVAPISRPLSSTSTRVERLPFHQSSANRPCSPGLCLAASSSSNVCTETPRSLAAAILRRHGIVHEPGKDVADAALAGLVAVQAGHDAVLHDAAHAGRLLALGRQHHSGSCSCP